MPEQRNLVFSQNTATQIINYHEAKKTESRTEGSQVKLTPTQKTALSAICREQGIGVSTFISDALDAYIEMFPYKDKIRRHRLVLLSVLDSLS